MDEKLQPLFDEVVARNPGEVEFQQAVREVLECLGPVLSKHPDLAEQIVLRSHTDGGTSSIEVATQVLAAADTWALPSLRPGWHAAIESALLNVGIEPKQSELEDQPEDSPSDDVGSQHDVVTLRNGETLGPFGPARRQDEHLAAEGCH